MKAIIFKDEGYRIFAFAIAASLLWHLFWIFAVAIVSKPDSARQVKFSKVSFLGPLLGKSSMDLQARPKEPSFLENRYLGLVNNLPEKTGPGMCVFMDKIDYTDDAYHLRDERMIAFIDDALSADTIRPSYEEE